MKLDYWEWIRKALEGSEDNTATVPQLVSKINELYGDKGGITRKTLLLHLKKSDPDKIRRIKIGRNVYFQLIEGFSEYDLLRSLSLFPIGLSFLLKEGKMPDVKRNRLCHPDAYSLGDFKRMDEKRKRVHIFRDLE